MRDVVWQDGRVAELVYDLAPSPKLSLTPGCRVNETHATGSRRPTYNLQPQAESTEHRHCILWDARDLDWASLCIQDLQILRARMQEQYAAKTANSTLSAVRA